MKKVLLSLFLVLLFFSFLKAQDPIFSQYYSNAVYLNPAMAGVTVCPKFALNYRNQWAGIDGTIYTTYSATYDQHIDRIGGIGVTALYDVAGDNALTTTNLNLAYNYYQKIGRSFAFRLAMQAGFFQKKTDWSKASFDDMIDNRYGFVISTLEPIQNDRKFGGDFGAGFFAYTSFKDKVNYYGGIAIKHLSEPDEGIITESILPRKMTIHGGAKITTSSDFMFYPNILYQEQADFKELNIGLYVEKSVLTVGLWLRSRDALIITLGTTVKSIRVGYSYDTTVSGLSIKNTYGTHELSLITQFKCRNKKAFRNVSTTSCPQF